MVKRWGPRNLADAVSRMSLVHKQEFIPVYKDIIERQLDFSWVDKDSNDHVLGYFYELLTQGFYGGDLSKHIRHIEEQKLKHLMPDLIDHSRKGIGESKARRVNKSFNLRDNQIEKYETLQKENTDYKIYFALYSHLLSSTKKYKESKDELFKELADKTLCSIVLPFSIILQLNACRDSGLVSRFEGGTGERSRYDAATTPVQKTMALLYYMPESLIEVLDLNPENYEINRFISPVDFSVAGNHVRQFPILQIREKKYVNQEFD